MHMVEVAAKLSSNTPPPHSHNGRFTDGETVAKFQVCRRGEALGEDVGELHGCWYMKNRNFTNLNLVANKMNVDLDVFHVAMLHRVGTEINGRHVVAINHGSSVERSV